MSVNPTEFFDSVLGEEAKSKSETVKNNWDKLKDKTILDIYKLISDSEIKESEGDTNFYNVLSDIQYYRYKINLRGILLYLYGQLTKQESEHNADIEKIRKVIYNKKVWEVAPFLKYCDKFEKHGFPVISILFEIARDLYRKLFYSDTAWQTEEIIGEKSLIHTEWDFDERIKEKERNDEQLLYESTRKYFYTLKEHFQIPMKIQLLPNGNVGRYREFIIYISEISSLLHSLESKRLEEIKDIHKEYDGYLSKLPGGELRQTKQKTI